MSGAPTQAYISNALQVADVLEWILSSPHPTTPKEQGQQVALGVMTPNQNSSPSANIVVEQFSSKAKILPQKSPQTTIYQTTFSISEEFLRRIYYIKKRFPARFIVIIDRKALQKTVQLWKFISQVYDQVWLSDNHSKILLVDYGAYGKVTMVTSQNLTRGNRAESAVISSDPQLCCSLLADFEDLRKNNSVPMHEIMPTNITSQPSTLNTQPSTVEEIERLAGYFVPISDIAVILDINPVELRDRIADQSTPESIAYQRGKAKAKVRIRAQEMELAGVGSPQGLQSVRENLVLMESDEL